MTVSIGQQSAESRNISLSAKPVRANLRAQRHILHVFPTFDIGGVPLRVVNVINRLGNGYRHTIIALDNRYDSRTRFDCTASVECATFQVPPSGTLPMLRFALAYLRKTNIDMLATYNWGAIEWALANTLLRRGRHVHFESGFGVEEADRQIARRIWMRRLALVGASYLVVPSRTLEKIASDTWRISANKVRRVPNGIDVSNYRTALPDAASFGIETIPGEYIVGTVAPLRPEKNIDRLLTAFAGIPDSGRPTRLLIAGDGSERGRLEQLAASLGIADRAIFVGHVETVERVLRLIDVFAMSSDTEQMPNALLQAMAAGCAVAAVDVGDIGIMVAPENYNFIVPRDEPGALSRAIARLLNDDRLREQAGRANLEQVQRTFSMDRMLAAYRGLYDGQGPETPNEPDHNRAAV